jgi:cobalt-precorrin 5A hydrolase
MNLAIIAITPNGASLARRLVAEAEGAAVWLPEKFREADDCRYFAEPLKVLLPRLLTSVDGLVCIMATGIVVRLLGPHLRGKEHDPAVVVVDEAGQFAISLLSGHLGGANELATEVAEMLGGQAVITTATDVNNLPAWDDVARQLNMNVEPLGRIKLLNGLLLEGRAIALVDSFGQVAERFADIPGVVVVRSFMQAMQTDVEGLVFVTHRHIPALDLEKKLLLLRPANLVVGVGCNRGTDAAEIETVIRSELEKAFLSPASITCLASIDAKQDEGGLLDVAAGLGVALKFFTKEELNEVAAPSEPSEHALQAVGARGVCEPAAILAAGGGQLLVKKKKSGNVTVAVAEMTRTG